MTSEKMTHAEVIATVERDENIEATYSPEDNKLRLYTLYRVDDETYAILKRYGFKWAPKQELFVAPKWTPEREDLCNALAGEIEPEGTSIAERAQMKAERLEGYANNKAQKANIYSRAADELSRAFEFGQPILVGHHSERKARRTQEKMDSAMRKSVEATKAANYYMYKAASVEHHANYKNADKTRANRIKTLLSDLRAFQRDLNHYALALKIWEQATTPEAVQGLVNVGRIPTGQLCDFQEYCALEKGEITTEQLREKYVARFAKAVKLTNRHRWIDHVLNRLAYETELLGKVERFEGELTKAILQTFARTHGAEKPKASETESGKLKVSSVVPLPLHLTAGLTVEEVELTDNEWRDLMHSAGYEVPAKKAAKPPILNFEAATISAKSPFRYGEIDTFRQVAMTKAEYSKVPADFKGVRVSQCGTFRVRVTLDPTSKEPWYSRPRVAVFLTDCKAHPSPEGVEVSDQAEAA